MEKENLIAQTNTDIKIGIIESGSSMILSDGLNRLGIENVYILDTVESVTGMDVLIINDERISEWEDFYNKCDNTGITMLFLFNFGIGGCVVMTEPNSYKPDFIFNNRGKTPIKWMLDYAIGFNAFWNVTNHGWLSSVDDWLLNDSIKTSVGVYAMNLAALHTITAYVNGAEIERYPKFYLLTMVNQH